MLQSLSSTLREIQRLGREAPVSSFQDGAFEALKKLVRFDSGYWGGGRGPVEAVVTHYVHLHRLPAEEMNASFEKVKSDPKYVEQFVRCYINAGQVQIFDVQEGYEDFFGQFGVDQIMTLYLFDDDLGLYQVLSLYRSGDEYFTEQERLLFESAVPHVLDANRENRQLHLSDINGNVRPLAPVALVDGEGVIHFARPAFVELMRREWPDWRGPYMPEAMRRMNEGPFIGEDVAARFTKQQAFYLAELRAKGALDRLTGRELSVAKLLVQGASHKEIAGNFVISPATARNHIAHVYAKLGCSKAAQVSAILQNDGWT